MGVKIAKRYPIGTHCIHRAHGHGFIIGYNGQPKVDIDKQFKTMQGMQEEIKDVETSDALYSIFGRSLANSFYDNERYPYVIKFDPTEEYPEGFQEVYGPEMFKFSHDGENWCEIDYMGEVVSGHEVHDKLITMSNDALMKRGRWRRKFSM